MTATELISLLSKMPDHYPLVLKNGDSEINLDNVTVEINNDGTPAVVIEVHFADEA